MENFQNAVKWAGEHPKAAIGILIGAFVLVAWLF